MLEPEMFFEIEMKALLTKEQHTKLAEELPLKYNKINDELITTTRYRKNGGPEDVRLRHSDKTTEIVAKDGDPTKLVRREIKIPVHSKESLNHFVHVFEGIGFQPDPPWTKHKTEYEIEYEGYTYIICLQHIKNFAYILEVEKISDTDESELHGPKIKKII